MPPGVRKWLTPAAWVAGVSAVLLLVFPLGFPNYDTIYALVWGRELAEGMSPDRSAALPPTPHPLAELFGAATSPFGGGAVDLTMVVAYVSLGLVGYLVYRLGELWFDRWVGALAAAIVLTRAPFLSNGIRAYVDVPYIALCLGAVALESRRPRAGWPVLVLLALAGLLRPEAWLFSVAYLAWLSYPTFADRSAVPYGRHSAIRNSGAEGEVATEARSPRELVGLAVLALAAPLGWALMDLIAAGDPLYSWTGTKETVETLERQTGPVDLVLYGPRRLGEVLQWPGMVAAAGGVVFAIARLRRRSTLGVAAAGLAVVAFALLACAGLAILPRYTMLAAAILAVFAALGVLGWRLLPAEDPWRRAWQAFAAVAVLMFLVWGPNQYDLLRTVDRDLSDQATIEDDLGDLADSGAFEPICGPISVPNHRAVPRLAFDLDLRPRQIVSSSEQRQPGRGDFLDPASPFVIHHFVLDPNDPSRLETPVPPGFTERARNESWVLYRRC